MPPSQITWAAYCIKSLAAEEGPIRERIIDIIKIFLICKCFKYRIWHMRNSTTKIFIYCPVFFNQTINLCVFQKDWNKKESKHAPHREQLTFLDTTLIDILQQFELPQHHQIKLNQKFLKMIWILMVRILQIMQISLPPIRTQTMLNGEQQ